MASEKGDLPQDNESLPPNYASSEVYSDSPPPAYRKTSTVRLQMTRVVCITVLAAGFLTGMFILAHSWINTRNACDCDCRVAQNLPLQSASIMESSDIPKIANLDSTPAIEIIESNAMGPDDKDDKDEDGQSNDYSQIDQESRQMDIPLPDDDVSTEQTESSNDDISEVEENGIQTAVNDNKVKLPIDLLLGNPALAGRDVQCKVEKKIQNLGGGILSKTIMVTCDDDDEDDDDDSEGRQLINPFGADIGSPSPVAPPMSILAPILKMMAARAGARLQRQMQPQPVFHRLPQPFFQPIGVSVSGMGPRNFQGPFSNSIESSGPMPVPMMDSIAVRGSINEGPANDFSQNRQMPENSIMGPMSFFNNEPMQQHYHHHFESEPRAPSFPNAENMRFEPQGVRNPVFGGQFNREQEEDERPYSPEPIFRPFPPQQIAQEESTEVENTPPTRVIQGFPPQIPEAIKQIVSHIMRSSNKENSDKVPVIAIKAIPRPLEEESEPKSKLLLPFPFRAVKMATRSGRTLDDEEGRLEGPFPLPRGAIPSGLQPIVMPEAAGRALDSPVSLPSLQELPAMRFFPGRLLRLPVPLPNGPVVTHMEMKQNPNEVTTNDEKQDSTTEVQKDDNEGNFNNVGPDFGPPRLHTVIRGPASKEDDATYQKAENLMPTFLQRFPVPPPPRFAAEGRSGTVREINLDAELVRPAESRERHTIMVN
ncbi:uncharacterized protein LOC108677733 [Hyalella azteca]|uniref:Uncharacterized protein LOC108677733 n=1 Tax=Hyalella azteca TaxID=294128 RepID=A0A8B7P6B8_HYAAZ|nr:uncharacterized protein LOC108677733 [Hyalella azteca]